MQQFWQFFLNGFLDCYSFYTINIKSLKRQEIAQYWLRVGDYLNSLYTVKCSDERS
jgi:hypothetical protein